MHTLKNSLYILLLVAGCLISCNNQDSDNSKNADSTKNITGRIDTIRNPGGDNPYAPVDKSPMDISYYPVDYPELKMNGADTLPLKARVIYSRPQKKGRQIFGNTSQSLCQYGIPWRLGANEATELEFFQPATVKGKKFPPGRYNLYCIPYEDKWVMVFSTNLYSWGLHQDVTKDIAKIEIPIIKTERPVEHFTMVFKDAPGGAELLMAWDTVTAVLPISF